MEKSNKSVANKKSADNASAKPKSVTRAEEEKKTKRVGTPVPTEKKDKGRTLSKSVEKKSNTKKIEKTSPKLQSKLSILLNNHIII
jgi:hypothetical protein